MAGAGGIDTIEWIDTIEGIDLIDEIGHIIQENERRRGEIFAPFDPVTGLNSVGEREEFEIKDFPIRRQWLPVEMMEEPLVKALAEAGSVKKVVKALSDGADLSDLSDGAEELVKEFIRVRIKYDFAFWAATLIYIKSKGGGGDVLFWLNRPQRRLVERLEKKRKAGKPIRLIILKARQWGGSTCVQLYMAWLQLVHMKGLNSLIIAHQSDGSDEIKDMFDRMIKSYPVEMLHELEEEYQDNEPKMVGVGKSGKIHRVPQRNCKIKIGTAERPHSCRGGDYNLVHLSEVGVWVETDGKKPEDIVRSACSGVLLKPMTMIVYESTPNGVGNFFHREYLAAKKGESQFEALFVSWFEIEQYELGFEKKKRDAIEGIDTIEGFARWLWENRDNEEAKSEREEPGRYLWRLWNMGATLEGIRWYVSERSKYNSHGAMASEYASDDVEAFTFSGRKVFPNEDVEQFRAACRPAKWRGEVYGNAEKGEEALEGLRFKREENGRLLVWHDVERDPDEEVTDRYLVVVDVCKGHTKNADFADIWVLDRLYMMDGDPPVTAAEWHGHIAMDKLAWKAVQIAVYYNNALLVIESNTLETNNTAGDAEYILTLIGDVYDNLYTRKQSAADVREGRPRRYGFHTNTLTKKVIVENLKTVLRDRLYVEYEEATLEEYLTYVETDKGGFESMEGYHDDRLMTRAIGMQVCLHEMDLPRVVKRVAVERSRMSGGVVSEATIG